MKNKKTFIIAEAGVNHNGELKKAHQLIDIAASAGADAVKFQTINPIFLSTKNAKLAKNQKKKKIIKVKLKCLKKFNCP